MNVLVLTGTETRNACFRLRLGNFLGYLQKNGDIKQIGINDYAHLNHYDLVIIQRYLKLNETTVEVLEKCRLPFLYETDDYLWHLPRQNPHYSDLGRVQLFWHFFHNKFTGAFVSTPYLQKKISPWIEKVVVVPNVLPSEFEFQRRRRPAHSPLNIGFFGTPTHEQDFDFLLPVLRRLKRRFSRVLNYHFFGFVPQTLSAGMSGVHTYPFEPDYDRSLARVKSIGIDIGLAPLRDNAFNRSKSSIKYLEYTFAGGVGVYSDLTPYRDLVGGALCANRPEVWEKVLSEWLADPTLIDGEYGRARQNIIEKYRFEPACERFHTFLIQTAFSRPRRYQLKIFENISVHLSALGSDPALELFGAFPELVKADPRLLALAQSFIDRHRFQVDPIQLRRFELREKLGLAVGNDFLLRAFHRIMARPYRHTYNAEMAVYRLASILKTKKWFIESEKLFACIARQSRQSQIQGGAWFHLGELAFQQNRRKLARSYFQKCLQRLANHGKAAFYLSKLSFRDKNRSKQ
jgi:hypothetical protein